MTTAEERLAELLDEREEALREAEEKIEGLERQLDGSVGGWALPRKVEDRPGLPLPRLEFSWEPKGPPSQPWSEFHAHYWLVRRHFLGDVTATPLGRTTVSSGACAPPWHRETIVRFMLPFRDGPHAAFDASHLGLPCFAIIDGVPQRIDFSESSAHAQGTEACREASAPLVPGAGERSGG